jgi:Uma2 family endonuclease
MNTNNPTSNTGSNHGLGPLDAHEQDAARLWAEIHRLRAALRGPDGYATWQDAATDERARRVSAENGARRSLPLSSIAHQTVVGELARQLGNALLGTHCRALAAVPVQLPADQDPVIAPDLVVVNDPAKIGTQSIRGAPDWVIEVLSPSTASFDLIEKRAAYEKAGVRELWLVDILGGVVMRFAHNGTNFAGAIYHHAEGVLTSTALPELQLELEFMKELRAGSEAL